MLYLELNEAEQRILAELLDSDISELRLEIANTDNAAYRAMLKQREQMLRQILAKLQTAPVSALASAG
jgi:hypothetical protein